MIIILLFPFFIVSIFLVKNSVFPTWEGGNLSDWASTLCNVVMAGSALYAALQARKWFQNKKLELGHASAKNLFLTLFKMNPILDNLDTHVKIFRASSEVDKDLKNIEKILSEFYSLIADYERSIFELNCLGWKFKDKYLAIYDLPIRTEIDVIFSSSTLEEVIYLDDLENHHKNLPNSSLALENNVKELLDIIAQYNNAISVILNEGLEYEQYFQIERF